MKKIANLKFLFQYLSDGTIPFHKKIWIYLVVLYFIIPIDFIPEPILGIGLIDDLAVLLFSLMKLLEVLEQYKTAKNKPHRSKDGVTIENVEYKVHDE